LDGVDDDAPQARARDRRLFDCRRRIVHSLNGPLQFGIVKTCRALSMSRSKSRPCCSALLTPLPNAQACGFERVFHTSQVEMFFPDISLTHGDILLLSVG
jgi:hypothetical protein